MENDRIRLLAQEIAEERRRIYGKHQFAQLLRDVHLSLGRFLDSLELFPLNYQGPRFETRLTANEQGCAELKVILHLPVDNIQVGIKIVNDE